MTSAVAQVFDGGTAQARLLAVDLDLDGGIIELLLELDVAQEGNILHPGDDLLRVLRGPLFRSVPTMRTAIGVVEPKLITLVTMSPGWKPKVAVLACWPRLPMRQSSLLQPACQPRDHPLGENLPEPLAKCGELDPALLAERDANLAVVGPAHEEHHVVRCRSSARPGRRSPS